MEDVCLLVSDLDGTLLGDNEALAHFAEWLDARRDRWRLAYSSGRLFESIAEVVRETALPQPDAVIVAVGTEIRRWPDGGPLVEPWPSNSNGWDRSAIESRLLTLADLEPQPDEFQTPLKVSYYAFDLSPAQLDEIRDRLTSAGQRVQLIYSSSRDLDVLPEGVDKGSAAARLASSWGLQPWQVFVAGDTGNDVSMFGQGFRGIVVANARDELKAIQAPTIYQASRPFAAGVQEGLEFWLRRAAQREADCMANERIR